MPLTDILCRDALEFRIAPVFHERLNGDLVRRFAEGCFELGTIPGLRSTLVVFDEVLDTPFARAMPKHFAVSLFEVLSLQGSTAERLFSLRRDASDLEPDTLRGRFDLIT